MSSFAHDQTVQERIYNQLDGRRHQPVRGHQEEEPTHSSIGKSEVETVSSALSSSMCDKTARLIGTVRCLTDPSSRDLNWLSGSKALRDQQLLRLSVPSLRFLPHLTAPHDHHNFVFSSEAPCVTSLYLHQQDKWQIYLLYRSPCRMSDVFGSDQRDCFRRGGKGSKWEVESDQQLDLLSKSDSSDVVTAHPHTLTPVVATTCHP
jgi:hypothetical protein